MRILVAEHEDLARRTLEADLAHLPYVKSVTPVSSEAAASEALLVSSPDLLFLDMQLPEWGAFRVANRCRTGAVPMIVCTTMFDRKLVHALSHHRVEYLVRPFSTEELTYVVTRSRRPLPADPLTNLERLLDAALSLHIPIPGRIRVLSKGRPVLLDSTEIAALRFDRHGARFWTAGGVYESSHPPDDIARTIDLSGFRKLSNGAFLSTDRTRFGTNLNRARNWLRWRMLPAFLLSPRIERARSR